MRRIRLVVRGALSLLLFAMFGIGGILISPIALILRSPRYCQRLVRALWIPLVGLFRFFGIIGVDSKNLSTDIRGCVIAANHPSLIDVVLITALIPRTLYVAKSSLLRNPFMATIVRHTSLPVDEHLPEAVVPYLSNGWNVLVFPEGTRSPIEGGMHPFHRGVAQLILRTGAPLICLGVSLTRKILSKNQSPCDMGEKRVIYTLKSDAPTRHVPDSARALRPQAVALTGEIYNRIDMLMRNEKIEE